MAAHCRLSSVAAVGNECSTRWDGLSGGTEKFCLRASGAQKVRIACSVACVIESTDLTRCAVWLAGLVVVFFVSTAVASLADVEVRLAAVSDVAVGTEAHVFTLTVRNNGPGDAAAVTIAHALPAVFVHGAFISTSGAACTWDGNNLTCAWPGQFRMGQSANVSFVVQALPGISSGSVKCCVTGGSATNDIDLSNNVACQAVKRISQSPHVRGGGVGPLLVLYSTVPTPVVLDLVSSMTFNVANQGGDDTNDVQFVLNVPSGFTITDVDNGACVFDEFSMSCTFGGFPASSTQSITVTFKALAVGTNMFQACLNGACDNLSLEVVCDEPESVVLSVTNNAAAQTITAGTMAFFTSTVTNNGPSPSRGTIVAGTLPAGITLASVSVPSPGSCTTPTSTSFSCSVSDLAPGESVDIAIAYSVASDVLAATATDSLCASNTCNPTAVCTSVTVTIAEAVDLVVTKTDGVTDVVAGDGFTYTYAIVVTNNGPSDAYSVEVQDTWPAAFTLGVVTETEFDCSPLDGNSLFTCTFVPTAFAVGHTATLEVTYTVPYTTLPGSYVNSVTVTSTIAETDTTDNTATDTTTVSAVADLAIVKTIDNDACANPDATDTRTYTLTVTNAGPSVARSVVVLETFPSDLTITTLPLPCAGSSVYTCTLGDMNPNETRQLLFPFTVDVARPPGPVCNTVSVSSDATDPQGNNNDNTLCSTICGTCDQDCE